MKKSFSVNHLFIKRIGYISPLIAILFVLIITWYSLYSLPDYHWSSRQLWWGVPAFFLYPISLGIMLFSWEQIIKNLGLTLDRASNLYLYCINFVTRRLPMGLLWSAGNRLALYSEIGVGAKVLSAGILWEFMLHSVAAFLVWFIFELLGCGFIERFSQKVSLSYVAVIGGLIGSGGALFYVYVSRCKKQGQMAVVPSLSFSFWIKTLFLYALTWLNASLMLWLVSRMVIETPIMIGQLMAVWSFVGGMAGILMLLPNIGAKEISLTLLLSQFTTLPQAALITVVFRLLLTLSDVVWPILFGLCLRGFIKTDVCNR